MADERPMNLSGARVLAIGAGVTGRACAASLPKLGAELTVTDLRDDLSEVAGGIEFVESRGARFLPPESAALERPDILLISPGLSPSDPRVLPFRDKAARWMSEIELAYLISRGSIVAVTGSNGKTTVTTLVGEMLATTFGDTRVAGNIGDALIESVVGSTDETVFAVEVSSYQLEGCAGFKPDVGVILNVQPDHLARHPTMEIYAAVKARLLSRMNGRDVAILNADDERVRRMADGTGARVFFYSVERPADEGAFLKGGRLVFRKGGEEIGLCGAGELGLRGRHNIGNALAAAAAAIEMGVPKKNIIDVLAGFKGLEHRIETCGVVRGVECVNDSKATNPDSTIAALETYAGRDVTLILGGDDKGFDYRLLYERIARAGARVIVMGPGLARAAGEMEKLAGIECRLAANMAAAVKIGIEITPEGGALLLSPGSSSFDLYKNFEERGRDFKNEVGRAE
jgi:UDP-N-acetylmuramoylalanine--D-glutamate ligase